MNAPRPDISVVIPTRERWSALRLTLAALAAQRLEHGVAELIVVDNGSSDGSYENLVEYAPEAGPHRLRPLLEPLHGAAAARNAGVLAARAPFVLFLGDDCIPEGDGFVAGHLAAQRDHAATPHAVTGRTIWDPAVERTALMDWLDRTRKMLDFEAEGAARFYTGNVSVPRSALLEAGGFDQRFCIYGWEDPELALRLAAAGLGFDYRPDLLALHHHRYELRASLGRMEAMGRTANLFRRLHPDPSPVVVPHPRGAKGMTGRVLGPALRLIAEPPGGLRDAWYRVAHFAAVARGYGRVPLSDDPALAGRLSPAQATGGDRPAVSVILPFAGERHEAERALRELGGLRLRDEDELIFVDNTPQGVALDLAAPPGASVLHAPGEQSAYHARNVGAATAGNDWLLFTDADCRLRPSLLDDYFAEPLDARCGAVAGPVVGNPEQQELGARYARSRGHLSQSVHMDHPFKPFAITANLLVRAEAYREIGGYFEANRAGGDADFCFRLQDAGWTLAYRHRAVVEHDHRARVRESLRQHLGYAAGSSWLERRTPGSDPRPALAPRLARSLAGTVGWGLTAHGERALFKAIDGVMDVTQAIGRLLENRPSSPPESAGAVVLVERFPDPDSGQFVEQLRESPAVVVEASRRPAQPMLGGAHGVAVVYAEDDGTLRRVLATAWLVARHPVRCLRTGGSRPLRELAPVVRRVARWGVAELASAGPRDPETERIAALAGVSTSAWGVAAARPPRSESSVPG